MADQRLRQVERFGDVPTATEPCMPLQQDLQLRLVAQQAEGLGRTATSLRHCGGASVAASWLVVEHCAVSALVVLRDVMDANPSRECEPARAPQCL